MVLSLFGTGKRSSSGVNSKRRQTSGLPEGLCRRFSLAEIRKATHGFDETLIIGRGDYGVAFKGYINIEDEAMAVAIKCWKKWPEEEFKAEVLLLCQLRHPHILSLIGFCDDGGRMISVYEYMRKGILTDHLFGKDPVPDPLSWKKRLQICIGVARGLHYLHTGTKRTIVHRDVKPGNILLDDNWVPKVCGLALSKMASLSMSNAGLIRMDSVKGTFGYLDSEYLKSGYLTEKSDVYSFGVLLFEILSGRRTNPDEYQHPSPLLLLFHEDHQQMTQNGIESIDPYLKGKIAPECFKKFVEIAGSCVRERGKERPTMGEVEASLEFALELQKNADSAIQRNNTVADFVFPTSSLLLRYNIYD